MDKYYVLSVEDMCNFVNIRDLKAQKSNLFSVQSLKCWVAMVFARTSARACL